MIEKKNGRPNRAEAAHRRALRAATRFDAESVPGALERIAELLEDRSTPASVCVQLLTSAHELRALLPHAEAERVPEGLERRLAAAEAMLERLEALLPPLNEGARAGLILLEGRGNGLEG